MNSTQFKEGAKAVGIGCLYLLGAASLGALGIIGAGYEAEQKEKEGESFKDVMVALTNSNMSGYYQKEIIEKIVSRELTSSQAEKIVAICETDMSGYYKYDTIMGMFKG